MYLSKLVVLVVLVALCGACANEKEQVSEEHADEIRKRVKALTSVELGRQVYDLVGDSMVTMVVAELGVIYHRCGDHLGDLCVAFEGTRLAMELVDSGHDGDVDDLYPIFPEGQAAAADTLYVSALQIALIVNEMKLR